MSTIPLYSAIPILLSHGPVVITCTKRGRPRSWTGTPNRHKLTTQGSKSRPSQPPCKASPKPALWLGRNVVTSFTLKTENCTGPSSGGPRSYLRLATPTKSHDGHGINVHMASSVRRIFPGQALQARCLEARSRGLTVAIHIHNEQRFGATHCVYQASHCMCPKISLGQASVATTSLSLLGL